MAGGTTTTLSPPPFPTFTTTGHLLCSRSHNLQRANFPYPSFHHPFRTNPRISICRHSKLNNSTSEEAREINAGDSFFFDGDELAEGDETDDEGEEEEETEESSVDLLVRFLQSMVKKISKRAKKASRSVLPPAISTQLVSFAVDGLLLLASLSIVKALLEVVCNLGGMVFVAILLLRVIWATLSYFQTSGNNFNQGGSSYGKAQPVT
ncbi:protein SHORT HYPOCOTYL IN WHITE LIGHT 1 [Morus notabilis]|nr:protein SHORT HYPOCOTYL IN WHITE LIGHT 1 [Morus notabilis]